MTKENEIADTSRQNELLLDSIRHGEELRHREGAWRTAVALKLSEGRAKEVPKCHKSSYEGISYISMIDADGYRKCKCSMHLDFYIIYIALK